MKHMTIAQQAPDGLVGPRQPGAAPGGLAWLRSVPGTFLRGPARALATRARLRTLGTALLLVLAAAALSLALPVRAADAIRIGVIAPFNTPPGRRPAECCAAGRGRHQRRRRDRRPPGGAGPRE